MSEREGESVIDIATLRRWIDELGYRGELLQPSTLRIRPRQAGVVELPPFFVQCTESWVVLSMYHVLDGLPSPAAPAEAGRRAAGSEPALMLDLLRRLLEANREMRIAKFALGESDEILLCAELPTESLDQSEFADAVERIMEYAITYKRLVIAF